MLCQAKAAIVIKSYDCKFFAVGADRFAPVKKDRVNMYSKFKIIRRSIPILLAGMLSMPTCRRNNEASVIYRSRHFDLGLQANNIFDAKGSLFKTYATPYDYQINGRRLMIDVTFKL